MKFVFVILHYCAVETTMRSVDTILTCIHYDDYEIVIVDNASPDKSGELLKRKYCNAEKVHIIENPLNQGFARGNNAGYQFAKVKLEANFIICMNNDVMMLQEDFLQRVLNLYRTRKFYVLGPDIVTPQGEHQNPHRLKTFDLKDVNRIIRNRTIIVWYLRVKRFLKIEDKVQILEKWDERRGAGEKKNIRTDVEQMDVVLHGSCLIFSPDYIENEDEAFYPETFMWMEEEILTFLCQKKHYKTVYSPQIKVLHHEGISTGEIKGKSEKYFFYSVQLKNSARVMKKILKDGNRSQK